MQPTPKRPAARDRKSLVLRVDLRAVWRSKSLNCTSISGFSIRACPLLISLKLFIFIQFYCLQFLVSQKAVLIQ